MKLQRYLLLSRPDLGVLRHKFLKPYALAAAHRHSPIGGPGLRNDEGVVGVFEDALLEI